MMSPFLTVLSKIALGVLYNPKVKQSDNLLSLDFELDERRKMGDTTTHFMEEGPEKDRLNEDVYEAYDRSHPEDALVPVMNIIVEDKNHVREDFSLEDSFLYLVGLRLFLLKNPKCSINEFYDYYGDNTKQDIENTLQRIYRGLKYTTA